MTPEVLDDPSVGLIDGWLYAGTTQVESAPIHQLTHTNRFNMQESVENDAPREWKKTLWGTEYTCQYAKTVRYECSDLRAHVYYDEAKRPEKAVYDWLTPMFRINTQTGTMIGFSGVAYPIPDHPAADAYRNLIREALGDTVDLSGYIEKIQTVCTTINDSGVVSGPKDGFYVPQGENEYVTTYMFTYFKYCGEPVTDFIQVFFFTTGAQIEGTMVLESIKQDLPEDASFPVLTRSDLDGITSQIMDATKEMQVSFLTVTGVHVRSASLFCRDGKPYLGLSLDFELNGGEGSEAPTSTIESFIVDLQAWSKK